MNVGDDCAIPMSLYPGEGYDDVQQRVCTAALRHTKVHGGEYVTKRTGKAIILRRVS